MNETMNGTKRFAVALLALILAIALTLAGAQTAAARCFDYADSAYTYIDGSNYCAYTGGGCTACHLSGVRSGGSEDICYYDWNSNNYDCTYFY